MRKIRMTSCFLACLAAFSLWLSAARGEVKHWELAGWYGGGCYPNVEFDPNVKGRVYLVSDVAGIWRSTDAGESWSFMNRGLKNLNVSFISVAPSDSNVIYAGTAKGLFVRREPDKAWEPCDTRGGEIRFVRPANHRSLAVSGTDPAVISVGTASGAVFHSVDGGFTWTILGNLKKPFDDGRPITALAYGGSGRVLYAASAKGLARYSFETKIWSIPEQGPSPVTDFVLVKESPDKLYVAGQNTLFITEDGGDTWKRSAPVPAGTTYRVSALPSRTETLVAVAWKKDWQGGVVLSRNDGETWTPADQNMSPDLSNPTRAWAYPGIPVTAVKIDPFNEGVVFRTDYWGVWRSDDGGGNWKEKIKGAPNVAGSDIVAGSTGNIYVASMDDGLVMSADGGITYRPLAPVKGYRKDLNGHIWRVLVFGENDGTIVATSSPWGEAINQVLLSSDGGSTFTTVRSGLPSRRPKINTLWGEGYPRALAADPQNPNTLYLGIDGDDGGGLYISRDGGKNWTPSQGQPGSRKIYNALAVDPNDPEKIYWGACGEKGGVYLSKDRGMTWRRVFSEMAWVLDLKIAGNGTVYAAGNKDGPCLYASRDGGKSWKLLKRFSDRGAAEAIAIDPGDSRRIVVSSVIWQGGSDGKIYLSKDGGASWEDITGDLPPGAGAAAAAFSKKDGALYIVRYAGSVYKTDM